MNERGCIAFIPDRNGTWATNRGLPRMAGHKKGAEVAEEIINASFDAGFKYVGFWSLAIKNCLRRDAPEIRGLNHLLKQKLRDHEKDKDKGVCVLVRGEWAKHYPDPELQDLIDQAEESTRKYYNNKRLVILHGYDGIEDLRRASKGEDLVSSDIPEDTLKVVVRTGNTRHLSGFLPVQIAYGDPYIHFATPAWPDFTVKYLHAVIEAYDTYVFKNGAAVP